MSEREIERLTFALRWMAAEWAKYAESEGVEKIGPHPDPPTPDLVQGGVDMALEAADRRILLT